jgi:molecular chaperone DnaK
VLKEAGATLYTQSNQAPKEGPYAETRWQGPAGQPHVGASSSQAGPVGAGARVVDAEYRENK